MPTLCPIAIAVGCRRCPAFRICPVKGAIGDYRGDAAEPTVPRASPKRAPDAKSVGKSARPKRRGRRARARRHA